MIARWLPVLGVAVWAGVFLALKWADARRCQFANVTDMEECS